MGEFSTGISLGQAIGTASTAMSGGTANVEYATAMSYGGAYAPNATAMSGGQAYGVYSIAMNGAYAEGSSSAAMSAGTACGSYSTAMSGGQVYGDSSVAVGWGSIAMAAQSFVVGRNNVITGSEDASNWVETDPLFVVGNGTGDSGDPPEVQNRDALVVYKNGNVKIAKRQGDILMGEFGNPE